jgi:hypothetical protein
MVQQRDGKGESYYLYSAKFDRSYHGFNLGLLEEVAVLCKWQFFGCPAMA